MFLLDDLLLAPARGLMSVFRSLHDAALEELAHESENIRNQLSEMYVLLETGQMSEEEFDRNEQELLERLERIDDRGDEDGATDDEDDEGAEPDEADAYDADEGEELANEGAEDD